MRIRKIELEVTQKDINKARAYQEENGYINGDNCPVALALKRKLKKRVTVGAKMVRINDKSYLLPERVKDFITRYDNGEKVRPFKCTLELVKL